MCWRKNFSTRLCALISSTYSGDHSLKVSEKYDFLFWVSGGPEHRPAEQWCSTLSGPCWGRQQSEKEKWHFFKTCRRRSPEYVQLISAHKCHQKIVFQHIWSPPTWKKWLKNMILVFRAMLSPSAKWKRKISFLWNFHEMISRVCRVD